MIFLTVGVALITTFSVSGLCSRVQVGPGGVYFACGGHTDLARLLIDCGANLEEVNDKGQRVG